MWTLDQRACATFALVALAGLAGIASVDAQRKEPQRAHEQRACQREERQGEGRGAEARQDRRIQAARAAGARAAARRQASYEQARPVADYRRQRAARSVMDQRLANRNVVHQSPLAGSRVHAVSRSLAGGQVHVVRYGNTLSGSVERTIRPGLVSRTFVGGGHVLYTRVYQQHVWHQFGRAFAYEMFVPAVRFPAAYYGWALAAWRRPVAYAWGWQARPWYPTYGFLFTPYPVYTSPDLWMTDYILAQNMQTAYQAQTAVPGPAPDPSGAVPGAYPGETPAAYPSEPPPPGYPGQPPPAAYPSQAPPAAYPSDATPASQPGDVPPAPQPGDAPPAPVATPPAVTPQIKAQLNEEIKVQLQDQQTAAAMPATLTTSSGPPALRPNHVFFQVIQPLEVPSGAGNRTCSLSPDDYIRRTGGMSDDDWKIPVVVELSGPSDCPAGLQTRIGLNDLNAMENEQEAQVMQAMQAASRSMGPNGPPSGPGVHPTLIAEGSAAPDPGALDEIRQAQ
jgi:hypothetical protein